jgi:hypothetical protein
MQALRIEAATAAVAAASPLSLHNGDMSITGKDFMV